LLHERFGRADHWVVDQVAMANAQSPRAKLETDPVRCAVEVTQRDQRGRDAGNGGFGRSGPANQFRMRQGIGTSVERLENAQRTLQGLSTRGVAVSHVPPLPYARARDASV